MRMFCCLSVVGLIVIQSFNGHGDEVGRSNPGRSSDETNQSMCNFGVVGQVGSVKPSSTPSYFFRSFDRDGRSYVSYATEDDLRLLDIKSGKEYPFEGLYDPVPMNSDIITTPTRFGEILFYSIEDVLKGHTTPQVKQVRNDDKPLHGTYQSVGRLKLSENSSEYRVITDREGASYADYKVDRNKNIEIVQTAQRLCPNIDFKLPMISKDGGMLSGYDLSSNTTKVWKINKNHCEQVLDLGIAVGKADFSYDNKRITFHTTSEHSTKYFETPGVDSNMNVYVFDLEAKKMAKITQNHRGVSSYYPVFKEDGTIVFSEVSSSSNRFVRVDPKAANFIDYDPKRSSTEKTVGLFYIGNLFAKKCLSMEIDSSAAIAAAANITEKTCKSMVENLWNEYRQQIDVKVELDLNRNALTKEQVMAACPKEQKSQLVQSKVPESQVSASLHAGQKVMAQKCAICHGQFNVRSLSATTNISDAVKGEILKRINSEGNDKMPRSGVLTAEEKRLIAEFLATK